MDLFSRIFRSALGFDGRDSSNFQKPPEDFFFGRHDDGVPRPDELFDHFDQMFANFDRVFANFGNVFENITIVDPESDGQGYGNSHSGSLRDHMLKEPESNGRPSETWPPKRQPWKNEDLEEHNQKQSRAFPKFFGRLWSNRPYWNRAIQDKLDTDLDEAVKRDGIDSILSREDDVARPPPSSPPQNYSSSFSRVSVNVRRSADGKVEQQRTMIDSNGNETTVVTRSADGKTFEQTTTKKQNGAVEVTENWHNVNPDEQNDFKQRWNTFTTPRIEAPPSSGLLREDLDSQTQSIFEKLFPPRPK